MNVVPPKDLTDVEKVLVEALLAAARRSRERGERQFVMPGEKPRILFQVQDWCDDKRSCAAECYPGGRIVMWGLATGILGGVNGDRVKSALVAAGQGDSNG